ncbi:hypothetical protein CBR_g12627 [Chara braunii]|uniref:CCHC-type domain-containing protein n=1 Tax=Chara braunii TaxID=69332 RepID=A0A388KS86_CHABU|nr:hypothetical protein CBR_g12627 [Chara braunii]|eukprot:GBG72907.1 hypothetical protein CBR_g12627 [Chara braunii]
MDDKMRWDQMARVRKEPLAVGDVVLLYDSSLEKQWSRKLDKRWMGPYRILRCGEFGAYQIEELNGTGSDFSKTAMQRGGRDARPQQRPSGASRGNDQRRPFGRESTPVFNDDNIELFLDAYQGHATQEGWTTLEMIRNLRGVGRFEEPIAHIREEALTWPDVEARMQRLRALPVGRDGLPIRLEEGNAEEFIPAYEAERPLARQIRDRARDWEDCQAQLRQAFWRPEPERPEPWVERRQRSKRPLDPETRGATATRRSRKALARREEEPVGPAQAAGPLPTYGFERVEFRQITSTDLQGPSLRLLEEGEDVLSETPLRSLEAHLDASQWGTSQLGIGLVEPARYGPVEGPQGLEPETEPREPGEPLVEEVITVGDDTPPHTPVPEHVQQPCPEGIPEPDSGEVSAPAPEAITSPRKMAEIGGQEEDGRAGARTTVSSRLAEHAAEHSDTEMPASDEPPPELPHVEGGASAEAPARGTHEARTGKTPGETVEEKSTKEQSRYGIQGERMQGLFGQGVTVEPPQQKEIKEVFLDPAEAETKRKAEGKSFSFKDPTELASQQATPMSIEAPAGEPTQRPQFPPAEEGFAEESPTILLEVRGGTLTGAVAPTEPETVETVEKEASRLDELVAAMEVDMPLERPQRLDTPEYRPENAGAQASEGTEAAESEPQGCMGLPLCYEGATEAAGAPSISNPQGKRKPKRWFDSSCFFCKEEGHQALQCEGFLKDKAEGRVTERDERFYDRQGRVVERTADGGRPQLYRQNQEEMSE